jgi:hypothetical protein
MPNINEAFPSKFLKASDLQGRQVTIKMDRAEFETISNERKLVLYFIGKEKGMVLNKTNANAIGKLYGDNTDDWHDQPIVLVDAVVDFKGEMVHALRVMPPQRQQYTKPESGRQPPAQPAPDDMSDTIPF